MSKNKTLGEVIFSNLKNFYPNTNLGLTIEDVDGILSKASITKKNVKKNEIGKIIKILKNHIEQALVTKDPIPINNVERKFPEMEKINDNMNMLNLEYINNLEKMRSQEIDVAKPRDIPKVEERQKILEEVVNYNVIVDSLSRNIDKYPDPAEYSVDFTEDKSSSDTFSIIVPKRLNNIMSIELTEFIINDSIFNDDIYIILEIEEVGTTLTSNNQALKNCFTRLYKFDKIENFKGKFRIYDIPNDTKKDFTPLKNFTSLSIKIKNSKGELIVFNREKDNKETFLNSLKFKFTKKEQSMDNSLFI